MNIALELTAAATASRARMALVVAEELRARDVLCGEEASDRTMYAAEERRARVDVATWESERQLLLVREAVQRERAQLALREQLMSVASNEQRERADLQRDEARVHADMVRSEATEAAAIRAAIDAARRDVEELARDEKHERYTIHEDEREARRHILQRRAEVAHDAGVHQQLLHSASGLQLLQAMDTAVAEFTAGAAWIAHEEQMARTTLAQAERIEQQVVAQSRAQSQQREDSESVQRDLETMNIALELTAAATASRARMALVVAEELRARDVLCGEEASDRTMYAAEERRARVDVATWESERQLLLVREAVQRERAQLALREQLMSVASNEQRERADLQRDEARVHADMVRSEATEAAAIRAAIDAARRDVEELARDEKHERYTIHEDEREARRHILQRRAEVAHDAGVHQQLLHSASGLQLLQAMDTAVAEFTAGAAWIAHEEQMARTTLAQAERIEQQVVAQSRAQSQQREDSESVQRDLETMNIALELTAAATASRARMALVVAEELRARDVLCGEEASDRTMYAAEERRARVDVATWESERQLLLVREAVQRERAQLALREQLMSVASNEQRERADLQRDEARVHADMVRSEATEAAAIRAAIDAARRDVEELARDEKHERYTIHEDEREARRHILQRRVVHQQLLQAMDTAVAEFTAGAAWIAHEEQMARTTLAQAERIEQQVVAQSRAQSQQREDSESVQRDLETMNIALELTAAATASRARMALVVAEELRARDVLCGEEASDRTMYAAEERRARVDVATWESERRAAFKKQLMSVASNEQRERADLQRDEARVHADMVRSEATEAAAIRAAIDAARRDVEELARDEKHERYTIHEDEREARRHILQRRVVHQQLLQAMDTAVAEFTAGAAWIAHEEQMARTTLAQAERIEQQVVAQSRAQSQQREDSESVQRDLETMNIALELTAAATASRARMALVVAEELRARDVLCGEEASDRTMYAAEERRARVDVATWESERQLLLVREAVQRERAQLALREQLMSVASNEQRERADLQRDEARVHADMVRSEATEAAAIRAAIDAARRDVEELARDEKHERYTIHEDEREARRHILQRRVVHQQLLQAMDTAVAEFTAGAAWIAHEEQMARTTLAQAERIEQQVVAQSRAQSQQREDSESVQRDLETMNIALELTAAATASRARMALVVAEELRARDVLCGEEASDRTMYAAEERRARVDVATWESERRAAFKKQLMSVASNEQRERADLQRDEARVHADMVRSEATEAAAIRAAIDAARRDVEELARDEKHERYTIHEDEREARRHILQRRVVHQQLLQAMDTAVAEFTAGAAWIAHEEQMARTTLAQAERIEQQVVAQSRAQSQQREDSESVQRDLETMNIALELTAAATASRARMALVVAEELRARDVLCGEEASDRTMYAAEERRARVDVATWESERQLLLVREAVQRERAQLALREQLMSVASNEQRERADLQRDEARVHADMVRSEATEAAAIRAAIDAARRDVEELARDEKHERYTIHEDEREARRHILQRRVVHQQLLQAMDTAVAEFTAGAAWIAHEEQMARTTLAQAERIEQQVVAQSRAQSQQREDSESVQRDLETMNIALELTAAATASRARMALVVAEELRARDVLCGEEASDRTMYAAEERRARVDVATWESERRAAFKKQLMSVASNEQRERADLQRDEARVHADMVRSEATEAAAIRAAIDAARRDVEELARDEKHERYTIHEDEREARRHILQRRAEVAHDAGVHQQLLHSASGLQLLQAMDTAVAEFTAGAAWIAHEEQMARTTLAQAERIEQQVVAQSRAQSQQREDSESVQRDLETMNIALELTAAATASRARMALVVAEELRARDVLCGEEASDRTMYAAEERRARVDVATWESERQLLLVREAVQRERAQLALREQLMSVASNEQRERADLQRDEARVHADMVRSEATEAAAIRAAIDAARRDVEELARDEKHERYTIHEDEREARRHILQRRVVHQQLLQAMDTAVAEFTAGAAWIAHEEQMARTTLAQAERIEQQVVAQSRAQSQQREDSESVQRDLETMNIALELTAAATASRARMALVVAEELRARDVLCGEEASDRTMYAAEERRARVDVATWESERRAAFKKQLMSVASNEQRERADLQRDEARVHADMVRSEATEAAAIRAAIDAARRDVEELARDEKHERYTIHEDEREARRHILQRRAEVAHDAGVHQQLLHSASGLQLLQAMDTAVAEFTAGAAWIAHEEQMARTTLAQAERIEQQVVAQSRAQSQQREDSESVQRDLETMNIALELTAAATASRARMALVVAEELRARDVLCGEEASDRTMYAAEERRARVDVATWESERQLLLVREAVQRERAQLALREQLMSVASNEQRERADLQRDEARVHADMVRSEATEAAAIRAAIDAARRDVEELARDEKHERYTIHEDEREARRHILQRRAEVAHDAGVHQQLLHSASGLQLLQAMDTAVAEFTAGAAWIAHEEQMARTTLAQAERIEQQVVAQSRAQSQQREDSESVQRDLETMNIALELTAAATASRARMALVVAEELRARDVLCGEEASDRTMYAAEERRARVDVATWESERRAAFKKQLMSVASNEQRERADLQRDEARVHADMVRSEATEAAAIRAAIDAARRDVEELARDEKHERYTIHEDEREARRHILQRRVVHQQLLQAMDTAVAEFTAGAAWIAHEEQMARTTLAQAERIEQQVVAQSRAQSQQREDSESVQRDLETMNIALELTAAATASRARMALVVAEELRARDVLCGEEASDRTMYAAEERRARVDVATWESERQLLLVREAVQRERAQLALREQLMSVASNEQRERADLQRDEARVHADMVRSEATEAAAIRAAIDAARRDVEELARDEKHERYTIHEDEREARRHILQRRAEVAHDAGVHQQLLHSASGLQLLQAMDTAVAEFTAGAAWIAHEEQMARTTLAQAERIEQQVVAQSRAQSQQREDSESVQRDLETMNIALELTAAATASRARMALVVAEELRARDVLCGEEASDRTMYAAEERRARVDVATWESERRAAFKKQLMSVASNEQRERADLQRDEARVHADMVRSEATEAAAIRAAIDAARRDVEELARDEKHERYTIHEDEREARRHILQRRAEVAHDAGVHQQLLHSASGLQLLQAMDTAVAEFTAGAAWIAHEEQMARTTLAQAERIEQQVVAQSRAQSQQREDSESVQRDLETMNIALELTAAATASRARMALVVAEELRARDVLCGEEASDRTMYAAEERRARVDVATWESERRAAFKKQLMSVASNEQRERADLQRDEARVHADMVRSEATEAAAIRAAIDAARRDVEELARDEKHERYTIHEDEREARRHILQRRAEVAHDAGVHQQLLHSASGLQLLQAMDTAVAEFTAGAAWIAHEEQMARTTLAQAERIEQQVVAQSRAQSQQREDSESVQRDLETMNIALELTAAATASRARMALVVAEELRARDVLCGEEASDRTMYAAEERRARVDVATWESERRAAFKKQLMSVASNEQRERADLQRDEARVHADMVRSEATEAAAIRAAIDAARRDVEELARDEKHERYTIHEDEREARRHILQRRAEVAHDAGVHQQLLHSASGLQLLQAMDTAVAEFTAGAAWIAHEEQMARTTLAQAERIEQQVVAQSRAQSQQREDSESVQRDLETMNIALELTAAATASRARMALVVAEELRARDVLCGEEASDRTMYAAEERRARVDVATWESERRAAFKKQLMSVASNEQRERADLQRDEARVHADMVRSEATEAAAIRAAIDAARRDVEELARDEKHERYTIHEDEREARRHILQRRAEVAHDAGVHQQLLHSASGLQLLQAMDTAVAEFTAGAAWIAHEEQMARTTLAQAERIEQQVVAQSRAQSQQREDSESVQRDLETMNIALELTAAATASRARMALVVAEELRARDVLCGEEASDRTMYAAEERRARVDVATWESERQLLLVREAVQRERAQLALREQLMSVASNEQRERADLQRDEARVHADMVRSEATEAAAIRAAIDAARRDVEELARDEKHERYTIHEDEREARRHILQRRAEVAHDAGVHQQLLHSASGLQLLQAMDTAVAEFTAGAAWIAHEEQVLRYFISHFVSIKYFFVFSVFSFSSCSIFFSDCSLNSFFNFINAVVFDVFSFFDSCRSSFFSCVVSTNFSFGGETYLCPLISDVSVVDVGYDVVDAASVFSNSLCSVPDPYCSQILTGSAMYDFKPVQNVALPHGASGYDDIAVLCCSVPVFSQQHSHLPVINDDEQSYVASECCLNRLDADISDVDHRCSDPLEFSHGPGVKMTHSSDGGRFKHSTDISAVPSTYVAADADECLSPPLLPVSRICRVCFRTETSDCVHCASLICFHCRLPSSSRPCCKLHYLSIVNNRQRILAEKRLQSKRERHGKGKRHQQDHLSAYRDNMEYDETLHDTVKSDSGAALCVGRHVENRSCTFLTVLGAQRESQDASKEERECNASSSVELLLTPPKRSPHALLGDVSDKVDSGTNEEECLFGDVEPKTERKQAKAFFVPLYSGGEPRRPKPPTPRNYIPHAVPRPVRQMQVRRRKCSAVRQHFQKAHSPSRATALAAAVESPKICPRYSRYTSKKYCNPSVSGEVEHRKRPKPLLCKLPSKGTGLGGVGMRTRRGIKEHKWAQEAPIAKSSLLGVMKEKQFQFRTEADCENERTFEYLQDESLSTSVGLARTYFDGKPVRSFDSSPHYRDMRENGVKNYMSQRDLCRESRNSNNVRAKRVQVTDDRQREGCSHGGQVQLRDFEANLRKDNTRMQMRNTPEIEAYYYKSVQSNRASPTLPRLDKKLRHLQQHRVTVNSPDVHCVRYHYHNNETPRVDNMGLGIEYHHTNRCRQIPQGSARVTHQPCITVHLLPRPGAQSATRVPTPSKSRSLSHRGGRNCTQCRTPLRTVSPPWRTDNNTFLQPPWNVNQPRSFVAKPFTRNVFQSDL
ncbi:hypothetical protein ERJ75_000960100 [Trypanosoma vivax]|nr:hypothetical protein ERJ75_000960100 [Trypanosoma vivax]